MKQYLFFLLIFSISLTSHACPLTISNDDTEKRDIIVASTEKAYIIRYGKTGTVGTAAIPTTFLIYTARSKGETEVFRTAYQVTEKFCPETSKNRTSGKKGKVKKETLKLGELQARSKTDIATQKGDKERFVVEALGIKK